MSGSKSKFPGSSMNVGNTPGAQSTKGGAKSSVSASKKGGGAATTAAPLASGIAGNMKSGPVQVFLNGKIVTPQSLIPRKSGHSHHGKKLRTNITKPQTIDENSSDNAEKPIHGFPSKINLKRNEGIEPRSSNNVTAGVSKLNVLGKNKPVVEESVSVILTETHTQMLLAIPSFIVASDTRDVIHTDERNARYDACVKAHKNVDSFSARTTQTKNNQLKNQNEMAAPNAFREFGSQAISYEIKDEIAQATATNTENDIAAGLAVGTDTADDISGLNSHVRKFVSDTVGVALVTPGCLLDTTNAIKPPVPGEHAQTMPKKVEKNKNKSMVSRSMANTSEVQSEDEGNFGFSVGNANKGGKGKKDDVSSASSGNNSNPDNVPPSGSRANISQSNAGDSAVDSEDGLGGGGSRTYGGNATFTEEDSQQILRENEIKNILNSPMLLKRLHMIERAIQQNANYRNQLDYRDLPDIPLLQLLSADRAKHVENADQLFGASTLGGKSSMGMKRTFTDRSKSLSHGMLNHEGSFNDAASTVSSEGDRGSLGGDGPGSVRLKAENLFHLDASNKTKKLFCYSNPDLIQGRSVTSMAWNALSTDLLAVGYGRSLDLKKFQQPPSSAQPPSSSGAAQPAAHTTSTGNLSQNKGMAETKESTANHNNTVNQGNVPMNMIPNNNNDIPSDEAQEGLVLFWSLRNPDYPEKILRTPHSVTAVEFSKQNPMILAVGLSNGDVNIYDVKREGASWGVPIESSAGMEGSHMDPVWQLKWIVKGAERLETLVSISTDGRILEWNLKKGLVMSKLMQLKKSGAGEGWISNSSAGLCFDFSPADASTYVTGTEDGNLFRCSVSYNEQYLETYQNHEGPVYRVRFSNRWANVFLSCSADWSMNLYHLSLKDSLLSIRATAENFPINDICWCPDNATVFACVTVDAKLQIWDLSVSSIDPVVILDIGSEDLQNDNNNNANNESSELPRSPSDLHSLPNSPALGASRYGDRYDPNNATTNTSANVTPVARLLKNLAVEPKKRILTTVLFGENNPVLAVGDNRGNVSVYRVFEPITITNLGPLQQFLKLKEAVIRQTDPVNVNTLEADHGGYVTNNNLSGNNLLAGLSPAMLNVNPSASFSVPLGSASLHSIDTMN